jgi:proteic killer suppression protein
MDQAPGNCHQLHADRAEQFAVSLWGSFRLVFQADHEPLPRLDDGGIDKTQVTKIRIEEVVDYHGK